MHPFDQYPEGGRVLLGWVRGSSARRAYGRRLQQVTGQSRCTYCGVNLIDDYYRWLLLSVDHVVPAREAVRLGIPNEFSEDLTNLVLSCSACNGFDNQFKIKRAPQSTWTVDEFVALRDQVFAERCPRIVACHER